VEPGFDMNQLLQAAQQMQAQLANAQQNLADAEVTGTAGGGLVVAKVSGQGELLDLTIDPKAIDPADPAESAETIADLVLAAVRDATNSVLSLQQQQLGFADALGNFDLSSLGLPGGLPGGVPGGMPGGLPGFAAPGGISGLPSFATAADDLDDDDDEDWDEDDEDDEFADSEEDDDSEGSEDREE
jgi:DNA-binding YbaB/EbfC family protein